MEQMQKNVLNAISVGISSSMKNRSLEKNRRIKNTGILAISPIDQSWGLAIKLGTTLEKVQNAIGKVMDGPCYMIDINLLSGDQNSVSCELSNMISQESSYDNYDYELAKENAITYLLEVSNELEDAKENLLDVKRTELDGLDGMPIDHAVRIANRAAKVERIMDKSLQEYWASRDDLFLAIVEYYFVPYVLKGSFVLCERNCFADDSYNYFLLEYIDVDGFEQQLYLNYKLNQENSDLIIYEKTKNYTVVRKEQKPHYILKDELDNELFSIDADVLENCFKDLPVGAEREVMGHMMSDHIIKLEDENGQIIYVEKGGALEETSYNIGNHMVVKNPSTRKEYIYEEGSVIENTYGIVGHKCLKNEKENINNSSEFIYLDADEAAEAGLKALNETKDKLHREEIDILDEGYVSTSAEITLIESGTYISATSSEISFSIISDYREEHDPNELSKQLLFTKMEKIKETLGNDYYLFDELQISECDTRLISVTEWKYQTNIRIKIIYAPIVREKISESKNPVILEAYHKAKHLNSMMSKVRMAIENEGGICFKIIAENNNMEEARVIYIKGERFESRYIACSDYEDMQTARKNADEGFLTQIRNRNKQENICVALGKIGNVVALDNTSFCMNLWKNDVETQIKYRYTYFTSYLPYSLTDMELLLSSREWENSQVLTYAEGVHALYESTFNDDEYLMSHNYLLLESSNDILDACKKYNIVMDALDEIDKADNEIQELVYMISAL